MVEADFVLVTTRGSVTQEVRGKREREAMREHVSFAINVELTVQAARSASMQQCNAMINEIIYII